MSLVLVTGGAGTIGSAVVVAGTVLFARASPRSYGVWSVGLLVAFTALTTLSVVWSSVQTEGCSPPLRETTP